MFLIEKISNIKKIYYKIIIILSFIISWVSIGTHYTNLLIFTKNEVVSLVEIINFMRITSSLLCFPILCFMIFMNVHKYKENNINPYLAFIIPLLYFLSQIPGLFYTSNSLWNFLYVLSAINILIILNLIILNLENDEIYLVIFLTFILLAIVFFIAIKEDIIMYLDNGRLFYGKINYLLGDSHIRSSGTSRIALILLIIYSIFSVKLIRSKILKIVPLIIFSASIYLYQSRTNIGLAIIFIILNYIIFEKYTLINFFKYLLIYFVIPILLSLSFLSIHTKNNDPALEINYEMQSNVEIVKNKIRFLQNNQALTTSGRIEDWKKIINKFDYNNNLFFGYGAQADRYLINQTASNGLLYAFVSSGILGLMFFLILSLTSGMQVLKYLFFEKQKILIDYFCFVIMTVMLIRSLVETSYSLFGVDLILFYTAFILMQRNRNLK